MLKPKLLNRKILRLQARLETLADLEEEFRSKLASARLRTEKTRILRKVAPITTMRELLEERLKRHRRRLFLRQSLRSRLGGTAPETRKRLEKEAKRRGWRLPRYILEHWSVETLLEKLRILEDEAARMGVQLDPNQHWPRIQNGGGRGVGLVESFKKFVERKQRAQ